MARLAGSIEKQAGGSMSFLYGMLLGGMAYLNWHADTQGKKVAVLIVTATVSLIFGGLAVRGID